MFFDFYASYIKLTVCRVKHLNNGLTFMPVECADVIFLSSYKVDYENNKFIHTLTYTSNEIMWLLESTGVVEHK